MLRIPQSALEQVRAHGEQAYPQECCGVLLGESVAGVRLVREVARCTNACQQSPASRYRIEPGELVRLQRAARERRQQIVGFYHSHPDHPAHWSPADLAEANWPDCSYLITAVERGRATQTRSFVLADVADDPRFEEEEVVTIA